jgi:3-methyladenine DNA glycosylase AlkD
MEDIEKDLEDYSNAERAQLCQRYFKTGKGEYGEGDVFLGLTMFQSRELVKKYRELPLEKLEELLHTNIHEKRSIALLILVEQYKKSCKIKNENKKKEIVDFYLKNTRWINNWDLVDLSAHKILGDYFLDKPRDTLYRLARSEMLWEKRISIISTFAFIANGQLEDSLKLSEILLKDGHDLMHKAVGWVLREVGKKDGKLLRDFLRENYNQLPRTTLRYAIERFPEDERKRWLRGEI